MDAVSWAAVADALDTERFTSLTSINGYKQYAAIRAGGLAEVRLEGTELGVCVAGFLERSASTLTRLQLRCARHHTRHLFRSLFRHLYRRH